MFLFGRTLYHELDVDAELAKGSLPGAISLANKIVPATRAVVQRTLDSLRVRRGGTAGFFRFPAFFHGSRFSRGERSAGLGARAELAKGSLLPGAISLVNKLLLAARTIDSLRVRHRMHPACSVSRCVSCLGGK